MTFSYSVRPRSSPRSLELLDPRTPTLPGPFNNKKKDKNKQKTKTGAAKTTRQPIAPRRGDPA